MMVAAAALRVLLRRWLERRLAISAAVLDAEETAWIVET